MEINTTENLHHNVKMLAVAIAAAGAESATATYYGYGDEGQELNIEFQWPENKQEVALGAVTYKVVETERTQGKPLEYILKERTADFDTALNDIAEDAISEAGHEGYQNEDGGGGVFTVYANGLAELDHYDNVVEEVHDITTYGREETTSPETA